MTYNPSFDVIPPFLALLEEADVELAQLYDVPLVSPLELFRVSFRWEGYQWPKRPLDFYQSDDDQIQEDKANG